MFSRFNVPADTSWSFILGRLPSQLSIQAHSEALYFVHHPATALVYVGGFAALYLSWMPAAERYFSFHRAAGIGAAGLIFLLPQYSDFRLELVLLPVAAVGLARATERALLFRPK